MNRSIAGKWASRAVWLALAATLSIGCSPLNVLGFMFARDEKMPAPYPLTFPKDGPKKDKEEVVVLLLAHMAPGAGRDFVTADRELAERLAKVLPEMAKENKDKRKVRVISPTQVDKFKMANPHWKQMAAGEIGEKLGADFVLEIELAQVQLYQRNTPLSERIYDGRAEVDVNIYEAGPKGGELKDHYTDTFTYPSTGMIRSASAVSEREFKQQYVENLATEIAKKHVDHKPSNSIASGR
jgi:hypothetical protein